MKSRFLAMGLGLFVTLVLLIQSLIWNNQFVSVTSDLSYLKLNYTTAVIDGRYKVPNIVHFIWFENQPVYFRFDKALSVLSAVKYIQPDVVYFHTNMPPTGEYFEMLKNISIFEVVHIELPTFFLKTPYHETDYSDFKRVQIILEQGGIYLDFDVIVIKSFDPLRLHDCTMGLESPVALCGGVIICTQKHPFLYMWLNSFYDDFRSEWSYNTGQVSTRLMKRYRGIIHVENITLHRPNWYELDKIWGNGTFPWETKYSVHTWIRVAFRKKMITIYPTPESIKTMNNTYGQISRRVF